MSKTYSEVVWWDVLRPTSTSRKILLFIILVWITFLLLSLSALASPPSLEEAKSEGRLTFYATTDTAVASDLLKRFNEKYPFIKTELLRLRGEAMLSRVLLEGKAGKLKADIINLSDFRAYAVKKENLFMKYVSPESENYIEEFKDPDGLGTHHFSIQVCGYNTRLVSSQDLPNNYDDLLLPKWKGKMGMDVSDVKWFVGQLQIMGEEKGLNFMRRLSKQGLQRRSGGSLVDTLLAAGEFHVSPNVKSSGVERLKGSGAMIDWVALQQPILSVPQLIGISAQAPHPNSAKLFIDFALSKENQGMLKLHHVLSARKGFLSDPRLSKNVKFFPLPVSLAEKYDYYNKLYREIFQ